MSLIRIKALFPNSGENTVTVSEIISINGRPFDLDAFLDPSSPQKIPSSIEEVVQQLTELQSKVRILENAVAFALYRTGEVNFVQDGSEPPVANSTTET